MAKNKTHDELMNELFASLPDNEAAALDILDDYYPDAQHHEHWAIDQMLRVLLGDKYEDFIEAFETPRGTGENRSMDTWDVGIAP